ncbi:hypothetical protein QJR26_02210 [Clostridium baratii]
MAKIIAPNKEYTGISASVYFCNGIGETTNKDLINWFKEHGYSVVEEDIEKKDKSVDEMSVDELIQYANEHNIDIGKATSQSGIIEKIKLSEQGE